MTDLSFDWQIDEFMVFCRSSQLRERTMTSYEQTLRLFQRWCAEQMKIVTVDKVTEFIILIRRYILVILIISFCLFFVSRQAHPSATPSKLPGIGVIWKRCSGSLDTPLTVPRENPPTASLLP